MAALDVFERFPLIEAVPYFFTYYCMQAYCLFKRKSSGQLPTTFRWWVVDYS